jgi:predicted Zn-dependent protease
VVVYTGLLALLSTEDELAAVLAHEVAHVVARHAAERITQGSALEVVRAVAYWGFGLPIPAAPLQAVFFLPNSRKAETEADAIGVQLAARACFDPGAAVAVFEKLGRAEAAAGGGAVPALLRTHPVSADRVRAIKQVRRALAPTGTRLLHARFTGRAWGVARLALRPSAGVHACWPEPRRSPPARACCADAAAGAWAG